MRDIRLVIFNEPYWDKGLIYTQNILPLQRLSAQKGNKVSVISFTSLPKLILDWKKIKLAKIELRNMGVEVKDCPVLFYPTRFMAVFYFMLPWFFLNVFFYIKALEKKDKNKDVVYSLRSYQIALGFLKFYPYNDNVIFDLRTDFIEENVNRNLFLKDGRTVKYWRKAEKEMLTVFHKSLFISDQFREAVLKRNNISDDEDKYPIVYNPIDYSHFQSVKHEEETEDFLYTGSLGHWNNVENYLDFFLSVAPSFPVSKLIICTNSPEHKVMPILIHDKYSSIRDKVIVNYNVPYSKLPEYYAKCKYGLQIMNKKDTRVGVKFIEYVAAGIIPIVHENVQGAAKLVEKFNIGFVFNDEDYKNSDSFSNRIKEIKCPNISDSKYKLFRESTDINMISNKLSRIYE